MISSRIQGIASAHNTFTRNHECSSNAVSCFYYLQQNTCVLKGILTIFYFWAGFLLIQHGQVTRRVKIIIIIIIICIICNSLSRFSSLAQQALSLERLMIHIVSTPLSSGP